MNRSKTMQQVLWQWWNSKHQNIRTTTATSAGTNAGSFLDQSSENARESLLVGEFSCGTRSYDSLEHVPKGYLAVYVGPDQRRFIIPTSYLSMPDFRNLMDRAAEEFGFEQEGGLRIPCEEHDFEEILFRCLRRDKMMSKHHKQHSRS
ncbi:hypothetical protein K2173_011026 [Erythroxylum novogranatense]|uniref:Uncharacterized protein n=1 Tax=Erythroxylum novogranatense TaxID=1862640 RepID=A0AAV8T1P2_9ROSI|nr:hypothetical protein K2173_011026 [Erythroxylum novogranatense]